jgi:uncharacterized protein
MIVDAHTHIFPDELVRDRRPFLKRDAWFSLLYQNPLARLATAEDLLASMDQARIDFSIVCGFPWRDAGLCDFHNSYMCDAAQRYPERLGWLGIVSTGHGASVESVAAALFAKGALGIGELNADAQGFALAEPGSLRGALHVAAEAGKTVMVHASEPVGHDYPGKGSATPDRLVRFAGAFPGLSIVFAHWGGGLPFYELMPEVRASLETVAYDSAASTYLYNPLVFRQVLDLVGSARVLFASDYPVLRQDRFAKRVLSIEWRDSSEENAVMGENAMRVYGLGAEGKLST